MSRFDIQESVQREVYEDGAFVKCMINRTGSFRNEFISLWPFPVPLHRGGTSLYHLRPAAR
jgi:hypothetical protein